ncbi:MAG: MmcQ/YjbR family DNA-binding protein [Candidatus Aquilonibacter sp.]|jgi:hypothetical protein
MATWNDVARLATALPSVVETGKWGMKTWAVKDKAKTHGFAWERPLRKNEIAALGVTAPKGAILGARTADLGMKEALLARNPDVYFTTPHFDGYPAILVRLSRIKVSELRDLLVEAWLARAPERLVKEYLAGTSR